MANTVNSSKLYIYNWIDGANTNHYAVRGRDDLYNEFTDWLLTTSFELLDDDFPWSHFCFRSIEDDGIISAMFGQYIHKRITYADDHS